MKIDLKSAPFHLNDEQMEWVNNTLASLTVDEKIGQLFCPVTTGFSRKSIKELTQEFKVGSVMLRPFKVKGLQENLRKLQESSKVPMLISANLEAGGNGALAEGTLFAMPEGCTATGDTVNGYRLGKISTREAASVGVNWGFAPIVDIDMNYNNPITNIRSFGNDPDIVIEMARGYLQAAREENVLPTIKHFPGDGVDERDQHLLVSVNSLGYDEWMQTYGRIYKTLIDEGAPAVMCAHIAQPNVARKLEPTISDEEALMPATLSKTLQVKLLRETLGFNGLVVTDSTLMVGFMQKMPRRKAVPLSIEYGTDVFLFNRSLKEDVGYMKQGLEDGLLSAQRLDEAVTRILATKASLNLHTRHKEKTIVPDSDPMLVINSQETREWVLECADKAVTLVKDNKKLLPISPQKTRRIYLNVIENYVSNNSDFAKDIKNRLEKEGFEVELRKRKMDINPNLLMKGIMTPATIRALKEVMTDTESFVSKYDMSMIVVNMETVSNATVVRIDWKVLFGLGNDIPWYAGEMPLVVISTANPYHLLDIPMADTYINAYTGSKVTLDAVFDKMMGRSEFKGISPVDPFCGHEDCKL
jgi:beta-N-acetylhexosaminidase